ncbi:MAG: hypothetical protein AB8G18_12700 [Gammaproteobacteria bacterium]
MLASNYRIVETDKGYSIFSVYYDASGQIVRRDPQPVIDCYADTASGVTDWLEAISLAAEKPSISLCDMNNLES